MNDNNPSAQPDDGSKKTAEPSSSTASPAVTHETASLRESDSPRSPRSLNLSTIPSRVPRQKKRSSSLQKQLQEVLRSSLVGTQPTEQSPEANLPNPAIPHSALSAAPRENPPAPEQADSPESPTAPTSEFSPAKSDGSSQGLAGARPSLEMKEPLQIPARMLNEFVYCPT